MDGLTKALIEARDFEREHGAILAAMYEKAEETGDYSYADEYGANFRENLACYLDDILYHAAKAGLIPPMEA